MKYVVTLEALGDPCRSEHYSAEEAEAAAAELRRTIAEMLLSGGADADAFRPPTTGWGREIDTFENAAAEFVAREAVIIIPLHDDEEEVTTT